MADLLQRFRSLMVVATEPVTNRTTIGQAAYNSMNMDVEMKGLVCLSLSLGKGAVMPLLCPHSPERGSELGSCVVLMRRLEG